MSQNQETLPGAKKKVVVAKKKPLIQPKTTQSSQTDVSNASSNKENLESGGDLDASSSFLPTYPMLFSEELTAEESSKQTVEQSVEQTAEKPAEKPAEQSTEPSKDPQVKQATATPDPEVPVKKKRGRKPKPKSPEDLIKVPKKRGRKPKVKVIDDSASSLGDSTQTVKKRGRKPRGNTYSLINTSQTPAPSNINVFDNKTYIITLKITSDDLNEILGTQNTSEIDKQMAIPMGTPNPVQDKQINGNGSQANYSQDNGEDNSTTASNANNTTSLPSQKYTLTFQSTSITTQPQKGKQARQQNNNITKELAYYLDSHFNNMYSLPSGSVPSIYTPVMPKIAPENANFNFGTYNSFQNHYSGQNFGSTNSSNIGESSHGGPGPGMSSSILSSSTIRNLTKIDLSTQIAGQWINRRVEDILPAFKDKDQTWPQQSPYACWNCTEHFDGPPIGIPDHIEGEIDAMDVDDMKFFLYGNFCNFPCAARYLFDTVKDASVWEKYSLLNVLHAKVFGLEQIVKVEPAPWRILLKKFGGTLSIEKYRYSHLGNLEYQVFKPPMIPILYQMEESVTDRMVQRNKQKIVPMDTDKVERKLKLRRLKPVRGNTLTIDKCMKMQVKVL